MNKKLLWLTDLHLDKVDNKKRAEFFETLRCEHYDVAVVTGDISHGTGVSADLAELARTCAPRTVYFVLGNHDFYGACIDGVNKAATDVCAIQGNLRRLGRAAARHFRRMLPLALTSYRHVWIATHVPPFTEAALFEGRQCGPLHLPHFSNISAGKAIRGISKAFRNRRVTVICGHTHCGADVADAHGVRVLAGTAKPGIPAVQRVFEVEG